MRRIVGVIIFLYAVLFGCCKKDEQPCLTCPSPPTDTTSHNFVWQVDTLGDGASSVLYDVAIINDTLAYAVGAIYLKDSLGNWDPNAYNFVKWDGNNWELKRIPFVGLCSAVLYPPLKTIWVFSSTNIIVSNGGSIVNYDGANAAMDCRMNSLLTGAINKIFAINQNDVYMIGNTGSIVYYNNGSWTKIESGTTLNLNDIWGGYNPVTKQWEILAVGSQNTPFDRTILQIQGSRVSVISSQPIQYELYSVWFVPCQHYYVIGDGIFEKNSLSEGSWRNNPLEITTYATTRIRGNGINDVFVVGAFGETLHYNGKSWHSYQTTTSLSNGSYTSVAIKDNLVVAVGGDNARAVIAVGRRY